MILPQRRPPVFGVVYCLLLTTLVYKELKSKDLPTVMIRTVYTTAIERILQIIAGALLSITAREFLLLLLINIMLLLVGMLMDVSPAILILSPFLLPITATLGMSPVHFGNMMLVNLCIGLCTPPVGTVLFVGLSLGNTTIPEVIHPLTMLLIPMLVPRLFFDLAR